MRSLQEFAPFKGYGAEGWPLGSYLALVGTYTALAGTLLGRFARSRRRAPLGLADVGLYGVATFTLTRLVTKDWVTAPLRAPFVRYVESKEGGEVEETSRGSGLRRAIGDLITCAYCSAPWLAGGLLSAHAVRPRETRLVAGMLSAVAISNGLNRLYAWGAAHVRRAEVSAQDDTTPTASIYARENARA